jgi:hypothetical protein
MLDCCEYSSANIGRLIDETYTDKDNRESLDFVESMLTYHETNHGSLNRDQMVVS